MFHLTNVNIFTGTSHQHLSLRFYVGSFFIISVFRSQRKQNITRINSWCSAISWFEHVLSFWRFGRLSLRWTFQIVLTSFWWFSFLSSISYWWPISIISAWAMIWFQSFWWFYYGFCLWSVSICLVSTRTIIGFKYNFWWLFINLWSFLFLQHLVYVDVLLNIFQNFQFLRLAYHRCLRSLCSFNTGDLAELFFLFS